LRVGVPAYLRKVEPASGLGKMWLNVLPRLASEVRVTYARKPGRRRWRHPDVWLSDGHWGPLPVAEPRVVQLHEATLHIPELRELIEPWFIEAFEGPSRDAATTASAIITPSESSRRQVIETYGVEPGRVHAVPHGVDRSRFRPGVEGAADQLAAAGLPPDLPYVLSVSQVHPRKNLPALREALTRLAARGFPHGLVVVGGVAADRVDSEQLLAEAASDLPGAPGRVALVKRISEDRLAALMAGCAAFCLPSLMEGFGLPALEAMACGVPVVVSDRGSLPEVVGDAGLVVPPTSEAVEEALAQVLSDPARAAALGQAAAERAAEFSWERTAAGWLAALRQAAG
jgi:glycosyltransferase involved in cell wall biosynthesis